MTYFLLGWATFVALVYFLMWTDYIVHKHSIVEGFLRFIASFREEE